jgi:hypothetical protein
MMGGKTPETCWAVNKCQDNKVENCCLWLVIYLIWTNLMVFNMTNTLQTVWMFVHPSFYEYICKYFKVVSALYWDLLQCTVVILYRRFETT